MKNSDFVTEEVVSGRGEVCNFLNFRFGSKKNLYLISGIRDSFAKYGLSFLIVRTISLQKFFRTVWSLAFYSHSHSEVIGRSGVCEKN